MSGKRGRGRKKGSIMKSSQIAGRADSPFRWRGRKDSPPRLSVGRARELVRAVLPGDEDDAARALVELLTGIAYEPDALRRDELALAASAEAFTLTGEFSRALDEFASGGGAACDG
ncbi:MAG TPA: hypothetical protein VGV34_07555 [Solirubrobacterales bacterium]|nr:hypothetical protein [Solirubrobacterales bacterium]